MFNQFDDNNKTNWASHINIFFGLMVIYMCGNNKLMEIKKKVHQTVKTESDRDWHSANQGTPKHMGLILILLY